MSDETTAIERQDRLPEEHRPCDSCISGRCGLRDVEIGSNRVYMVGCFRKGAPRIYLGYEEEVVEAAD